MPFLDLLNHDNDYNSWFYYNEKRNGFCLFAIKDIEKNEEIMISYGRFNNIYLYSMCGFTIKNNVYKSSIHLEINDTKFVLFENVNESEIMKVINFFKPKNIMTKKNLIIKIIESLRKKIDEYENYIQIYQENKNIVNICEDLKYIVNEYISLCQILI